MIEPHPPDPATTSATYANDGAVATILPEKKIVADEENLPVFGRAPRAQMLCETQDVSMADHVHFEVKTPLSTETIVKSLEARLSFIRHAMT
ncbi:MAG TPA: hypothetical protein VGF77_12530 [Allosphingosinicella sp.]|jgi:hypothetical protein